MNTLLKKILISSISGMIAFSSNAINTDEPDALEPEAAINGFYLYDCYLDGGSSIDFCDPKLAARLKNLTNIPKNFGKESVLLRLWDEEIEAWTYVAVNKKTKRIHYYPRALAPFEKKNANDKSVKLTFPNGNTICTAGNNVVMKGDERTKMHSDLSDEVDYCSTYDDIEGFGVTNIIDSKTRKPVTSGIPWI